MFEKDLHEGSVYNLSFLEVVCNGKNFKTTKHDYEINFLYNTKLTEVDVGMVSGYPYSLVSLTDILGNFNSDYLVVCVILLKL